MILFELKCASDHRFEVWFRNGAAYEAQAAAGAIACPLCGDTHVGKAPMAPRISKGRKDAGESAKASVNTTINTGVKTDKKAMALQAEVLRQLGEMRRAVEDNCDYVGERFAEEARRIHYGETDARGIYGEASPGDVAELKEEGVAIHRIPWLPRTDS
ncbi:DUF1178 family protein [Azospirillum sp. sgz301742]